MTDKIQPSPTTDMAISETLAEYRAIGTCTDPIERDRVEQSAAALYRSLGRQPVPVLILSSPAMAMLAIGVLRMQRADSQLWDQLGGQLTYIWGSMDAYLPAWGVGGRRCGAQYADQTSRLLERWDQVVRTCGWIWPYNGLCIVCQRPEIIVFDDNSRLHSEDGPALRYSDGYSLYFIHGVRVPDWVVERPGAITPETIEAEKSIEIRRIMIDRMGVGRYLDSIGAEVVSMDAPASGAPRALLRDKDGRQWLCGTDGSTTRVYYMQVGEDAQTCSEAHAGICGIPDGMIGVES